jgi:Thioesterase domain
MPSIHISMLPTIILLLIGITGSVISVVMNRSDGMLENTELPRTESPQQDKHLREELELSITEAEQQLLMRWNTTQTPFSSEKCIHQLFEKQAERTPELVAVQLGKSQRPFFFLHGDPTGGAFYCFQLARNLGAEQSFYALEPYRFDDLPIPPTMETMATAHIEAMRTVQPERPYILGGWCDGGLMAYEIARQLHAQGQVIDLLVLIDPAVAERFSKLLHALIRRSNHLIHLSEEKQIECFLRLLHMYESVRLLPRRMQESRQLKSVEGIRPEHKPKKVKFAFPGFKLIFPSTETLRQNYRNLYNWVSWEYLVGPYPGKITILWAKEEHFRGVWKCKVAEEPQIKLYFTPGTHMTSRTEHLSGLTEQFSRCICEAQNEYGASEMVSEPIISVPSRRGR